MDFTGLFARDIHPDLAELARYAHELTGEGRLPYRSKFDPHRACERSGYVFLIELLPEENDYFYSHCGERLAVLFGTNLNRKRLSDISDPVAQQALRRSYNRVVENNLPLYMRGHYAWPNKLVRVERLLIPMTDDDGRLNSICGLAVPYGINDADLESLVGEGPAHLIGDDELVLAA